MEPIIITKQGKVIAHHTTDSSMSHYAQPVWVVEEGDIEPGKAEWTNGKFQLELKVFGIIGGWLVAAQPDGLLIGIIWSNGSYCANLIVDRACRQPVSIDSGGSGPAKIVLSEEEVMEKMASADFEVKGTIAGLFDESSPLGCILPT